jgi:predicted ATPase
VRQLDVPKPTDEQITALESRCSGVKSILEGFASPWVVEFAGLPRAGKSGCIAAVEHLLRRNGISVLTPFEGAGRAPEHLKDDLVAYNAWTAMYAIQQILEGSVRSEKDSRRYEVVLLDRGLFDATAWLHLFEAREQLEDKDHQKTFTDFLRLKKWLSLVRQVFVFFCSPATALERELRGKLSGKPGRVVSEAFLGELRAAYEKACGCYEDDFDIATLETDGADQQAVAYAVVCRFFDAIESKNPN